MKKFLAVMVVLFLGVYLFGCRKKQMVMEETPESMSMESLSIMDSPTQVTIEPKTVDATATLAQSTTVTGQNLETLLPAGPYKPTAQEIQLALKNAGFYNGDIDGKVGPMTRKATEEFQKVNGLQVDGKVGPKTWTALSKYLSSATKTTASKK